VTSQRYSAQPVFQFELTQGGHSLAENSFRHENRNRYWKTPQGPLIRHRRRSLGLLALCRRIGTDLLKAVQSACSNGRTSAGK
jgi:hypothetical protein